VTILVYYGLALNISDFGEDLYWSHFVFGLVEIPARTVVLFTINRSRRLSQAGCLWVGGLACLLTVFIPPGEVTSVRYTVLLMTLLQGYHTLCIWSHFGKKSVCLGLMRVVEP